VGGVAISVCINSYSVGVQQTTRGKKRVVYKHNDVTDVDKKITKNLIADNNLLKANAECRSLGTPLRSTTADTGVALPDVSRYLDLAPASIPDICELNCGGLTATAAVQHTSGELYHTPTALSRVTSQVIRSAFSCRVAAAIVTDCRLYHVVSYTIDVIYSSFLNVYKYF
jgi:hypothetical protein